MPNNPSSNNSEELPPPSGDSSKADRYINQLIDLLKTDKLQVNCTDLSKFDPSSLQNHYRLDLKDYEVEVSHSKEPNSGKDFYVILFNNLKVISNECTKKIILAYMHLSQTQFKSFKLAADDQLVRKRKAAEEKRFKEAMTPINQALDQLSNTGIQNNESLYLPAETSSDGYFTPDNSQATPFNNTPFASS